jgi:hypothetical protein
LPAARHLAVLHDAHARNRRLLVHGRAASALTKSRRRIAFPNLEARPSSASNSCCQNRKLRPAKWIPRCRARRVDEVNRISAVCCGAFSRDWHKADLPRQSARLSAFGAKLTNPAVSLRIP